MDKQALLNRSEFLQAHVNYFSGALNEVNNLLANLGKSIENQIPLEGQIPHQEEDQAEEKSIESVKEAD